MQLKENIRVTQLLRQIEKCRGSVEFRTSEGDCLDLKSALTQYVFSAVCANESLLASGTLLCADPADYEILKDYVR